MKKLLAIAALSLAIPLSVFAGPNIQASTNALHSFNYSPGTGPSEAQIIFIQSQLTTQTTGTVTVTGSADYEVSADGLTFGNTATIPYTNDVVLSTPVYIRLKAGLGIGNYNNESVSCMFTSSSYGTTITVNGTVTTWCAITNTGITGTTAGFSWNATEAGSYEYVLDQNSNNPTTAGIAVSGTSVSVSGLTPSSNYIFHLRGNCGNGNFTNWTSMAFSTSAAGIVETFQKSTSFVLFPNPATGIFTVSGQTRNVTPLHLTVLNSTGLQVYTASVPVQDNAFSTKVELSSACAEGMYFVRINDDAGLSVERAIIWK